MGIVVTAQGLAFLLAVAAGSFLAFFFHVLRVARKQIFKAGQNTTLYDLIFWLVAIVVYTLLYFAYTHAISHLYILAGLLFGTVLYQTFISRFVTLPLLHLLQSVSHFFRRKKVDEK